jgi:hypothetical protein
MSLKKSPEYFFKFSCNCCNYFSNKQSDFNKHLSTPKHQNKENASKMLVNASENATPVHPIQKCFVCKCGKSYNHDSSYYRHKKKCSNQNDIDKEKEQNKTVNNSDKNDKLIEYLLNENKEIKELILEIVKNGITNTNTTNSHNTTHTNSHNKAFNLNFFLNETCKNAMNITDFVDSIKLQLTDFMSVGEVGFVEGISNIIVKNLNSLDETVRPIHCTDQKRETFYLKDENIWEKDDDDKKRMKQMIKSIAYKNEKLMKTYKETYPDYNDSESRRSDQYSKIMIEAMDCKEESREKIIKNISKATIISSKK